MINAIVAIQEKDRGIGYKGDLLYSIPEDMIHFRNMTTHHIVVMGRSTWESIPEKYRPLTNRINIVLTRDKDYVADGAHVFYDKESVLAFAEEQEVDTWIIGGNQIYELFFPEIEKIYITKIYGEKKADTFFPEYEKDFSFTKQGKQRQHKEIPYQFFIYKKRQ
ncbi:MAG: dihydrofolate reductase [Flavobacteriaceae bacterium]|jgi:dihydrofolate reductase